MSNTRIKEGTFNAAWDSFTGVKALKEHLQGRGEE